MTTLYGIKNCSTVAKARSWLESKGIEYTFWDYKKLGIDKDHLIKWCHKLGWEKVLNRSGMMYRKASDETKVGIVDQESAIEFMLETTNSIKRPIVELGDSGLLLGFMESEWEESMK